MTLHVVSTPAQAIVELNGVVVGKTPLDLLVPTAKRQRLRLSLAGYASQAQELTLDADARAAFQLTPAKPAAPAATGLKDAFDDDLKEVE